MISIRGLSPVRSACTSKPAGLLTAMIWLSSYKMGIRYPKSLILFLFTREILFLYVFDELPDGVPNGLEEVQVLAQETGLKTIGNPQHVVHHQHLSVHLGPGADSDHGDPDHGTDFRGELRRYLFKDNGKASGFFQDSRIVQQFCRLGFLLRADRISAEFINGLRGKSQMPHNGYAGRDNPFHRL